MESIHQNVAAHYKSEYSILAAANCYQMFQSTACCRSVVFTFLNTNTFHFGLSPAIFVEDCQHISDHFRWSWPLTLLPNMKSELQHSPCSSYRILHCRKRFKMVVELSIQKITGYQTRIHEKLICHPRTPRNTIWNSWVAL